MKKTFLSILLSAGLLTANGQGGPRIVCKFTPNTTGQTSWGLPSDEQKLRTTATAVVKLTPTGTNWPGNYSSVIQPAIDYATKIWEQAITSTVPININLVWQNLGSGILGNTVPNVTTGFTVSPGEPATIPGAYYSKALANKLSHTELNSTLTDATIYINSNPPKPWYFGTDGKCPLGQVDFVTNLLHEVAHALSFFTSVRHNTASPPAISYGLGYNGNPKMVADHFIKDLSGASLISLASPSANLTSFCQGNHVLFTGNNAKSQNGNAFPRLFVPNPFLNGQSINHWDKNTFPKALLNPSKTDGESQHTIENMALGYLKDIGWTVQYVVGVEDQLKITSYPSFLHENQVFSSSGTFYDNPPYGATLYNPSWKIEAYHSGGKVLIKSGSGYNGFSNVSLGTLPAGYNWTREWNDGTVRADLVLYGWDSQGFYKEDKKRVGIHYRPEKPAVSITSVSTCPRRVTLAFYAKGATSYRIIYANASGISESTWFVFTAYPSGNVNTHTIDIPYDGTFYFNVRAFNNGGMSELGNEVGANVYYCCSNCHSISERTFGGVQKKEEPDPLPGASIFSRSEGQFTIRFTGKFTGDKKITVNNMLGQTVFSGTSPADESEAPIGLSSLSGGMYIIGVSYGDKKILQEKIMISK